MNNFESYHHYTHILFQIHRGYQMSVDLILNLLNKLNKIILFEPLILFNKFNKLSNEPAQI